MVRLDERIDGLDRRTKDRQGMLQDLDRKLGAHTAGEARPAPGASKPTRSLSPRSFKVVASNKAGD